MPRKPRIHYHGAFYHVILRGNGGRQIFFSKADKSRSYLLLREGVARYSHRVHAVCLMSNHAHLAIQVAEIPLSRIMQNLASRYTRYLNQRKKRTGHIFQGRYKAILIDADSYLLELIRYIHLNPVRAGLVDAVEDYSWSSHRAYIGTAPLSWLTTEFALLQFSRQRERAVQLFKEFVNAGIDEGYRKEFHGGDVEGRILGGDRFAEKALTKAEQVFTKPQPMERIMEAVCNQYQISVSELAQAGRERKPAEARAMLALLVREADHLTLVELGRQLGRNISGLSQAAGRLQKRLLADKSLATRLKKIKARLQTPNSQAWTL